MGSLQTVGHRRCAETNKSCKLGEILFCTLKIALCSPSFIVAQKSARHGRQSIGRTTSSVMRRGCGSRTVFLKKWGPLFSSNHSRLSSDGNSYEREPGSKRAGLLIRRPSRRRHRRTVRSVTHRYHRERVREILHCSGNGFRSTIPVTVFWWHWFRRWKNVRHTLMIATHAVQPVGKTDD
jgi:hypothetical protein